MKNNKRAKIVEVHDGWLVNSWTEGGPPYWRNERHLLNKNSDKLYPVSVNFYYDDITSYGNSISRTGEDIDPVDPESAERANFIRKRVEEYERERCAEQSRKV